MLGWRRRRGGGEKVEKEWFYNEEPVAPACVSLLSQLEEGKKRKYL